MNNELTNNESRRPRPRTREHLMPEEVAKFLAAAKNKSLSRNPERDYCMLLLMVRHGLRVSEAIKLRLSDVDLQAKVMHVKRLKNGVSTTHPLYNGEVKAIKDWMVERQEMSLDALTLGAGNTLFISERRRPLERSNVCKMVNRYAKAAGLGDLAVHPHMLRHSCGYDLANRGVDTRCIQGYLGHRNIQHTVRYTELSPTRFANLY
jgi:type 1 fimbriae regulatory protein FimB